VYGSQDGAWNEIDIGMINNVLGQACVTAAARCIQVLSLSDA
jgi:hypothetical protein